MELARLVVRAGLVALLGAAAGCRDADLQAGSGPSPCDQPPPWGEATEGSLLADPGFSAGAWDSGQVERRCLAVAPWGAGGWGAEAASFLDDDEQESGDRSIDLARLAVRDGIGRVRARDEAGRWAFARLLQGDVWGGSSCGPAAWRRFEPIEVGRRALRLDFDACLGESELRSWLDSWVLVGANLWLSGPRLPSAGRDARGRKPLVLDLMVHHRTNMPGIQDASHENALAYHYQTAVAHLNGPGWQHVTIDLSREIERAIARFGLERAAPGLAIYQVEFVVEVHRASAAAAVDSLRLRAE